MCLHGLNFNWSKVNSSVNLASWLCKEREVRSITAQNTTEPNKLFSKHQPRGTGIICQNKFLQYKRKPAIDRTGLGRWCSWPFYSNSNQTTRIVVAYRPCAHQTKGPKTVYQQHLWYMQQNRIPCTPVQMFDKDLSEKITRWKLMGKRILLLMDVIINPLHNNLYRQISVGADGTEEFTHKCWGPTPPHTYSRGITPADGRYKSQAIEIVNLCMSTLSC
jgi:hypothetical protein